MAGLGIVAEMSDANENTVVDYTIEAMRDAIISGAFAPGQRLIVADITKMFSVSAGPVREAIRRLTGEGLVEIEPHRGASVRKYSKQELQEIHQIRAVIEGMAAALAAQNSQDPELRAEMEDIRGEMDRSAASEDISRYLANNQKFHDLILRMANNQLARQLAKTLVLPLYQFRLPHRMTVEDLHASYAYHQRIIAAILNGKAEAAERAMREHISSAGEGVIAAIETSAQRNADRPKTRSQP